MKGEGDNAGLPIVVAAYNRSHALHRLLESLFHAEYSSAVDLIISIDGGGGDDVKELARKFRWPYGEKQVIDHAVNLGVKDHIIRCGNLSQDQRGIILLEDDLYVSPAFYHYAVEADRYFRGDDRISGVSLYSHRFNETAFFPFEPIQDGADVYFLQMPSSWGQYWSREQWGGFKAWYDKRDDKEIGNDVLVPDNVLLWPDSSWKKQYFLYMLETDSYFVYPRVSYTTNFGDAGAHQRCNKVFQVPLQYGVKDFVFKGLDESSAVYDGFCELRPEKMAAMAPELSGYDFEVDLYGTKPLSGIRAEYLLTSKSCADARLTYGREMLPLPANVIARVEGCEISLAPTTRCHDVGYTEVLTKCASRDELLYHYPLFGYAHLDPIRDWSSDTGGESDNLYHLLLEKEKQIQMIRRSFTFRLGKLLLWPAQQLIRFFRIVVSAIRR